MRANDHETTTDRAIWMATGVLDHAAIEAQARQLRREAVRALAVALIRRMAGAWAGTRRRAARGWRTQGRAHHCCEGR